MVDSGREVFHYEKYSLYKIIYIERRNDDASSKNE
nr:MAG TPA: hypothetical protein [Caudoviricetes sp.]